MTTGARIVLVLFVVCVLVGAATGVTLYYRLAYVWGFLLGGSWLWSWLSLCGVRLVRKPRSTRAQMGQIFEERFEIDNPNRLPRLWIEVRDESSLPGTQASRLFPLVESRRGRTYLARTRLLKRGVYPLGPSVLESGDPFALGLVDDLVGALMRLFNHFVGLATRIAEQFRNLFLRLLQLALAVVSRSQPLGDLLLAFFERRIQRRPDELHREPDEDREGKHLAEESHD